MKARQMKKNLKKAGSRFGDGFSNAALRLGRSPFEPTNANSFSRYNAQNITLLPRQLEQAYMSSWVAALAVDVVAQDMCRSGFDLTTEMPEVEAAINTAFEDYRVWESLTDAIKWARLYGGAAAIMMIDGDDWSEPLNYDNVRRGAFKGLYVLDQYHLTPSVTELVEEMGPEFGLPKFYSIDEGSGLAFKDGNRRVHHSRVLRFVGRTLPLNINQQFNGWGSSVLEGLWDNIVAYDEATYGISQLVKKAHLRFYQVSELRSVLAMGEDSDAFRGLMKQFELIRIMQNNEGLTLGDKEDVFSTHSYQFSGLSDVLLNFAQQISGAIQVPLVRLLGQSPAGLNSTGESDLRTYYDGILYRQEGMLRQPLSKLLSVVYASVTGTKRPDDCRFTFRSLWQMNSEQKATVAQASVASIMQAYDAQVIDRPTTLKELKSLSEEVGLFACIDDSMIELAEKEEHEMMPPAPTNQEETNGETSETTPPLSYDDVVREAAS